MTSEEYIKRSTLAKSMEQITNDPNCPIYIAAGIDQIISQEPTADVVEVVRCGSCHYYECGRCNKHNIWIGDLNFCSYGEQRRCKK